MAVNIIAAQATQPAVSPTAVSHFPHSIADGRTRNCLIRRCPCSNGFVTRSPEDAVTVRAVEAPELNLESSMKPSDWIALGGAIATTAAVIVALAVAMFQEDLRRWRSRPEVSVAVDVRTFPVLIGQGLEQREVAHAFVRLRVNVCPGRGAGKGLQGILVHCHPPPVTGESGATDGVDMLLALRWAFTHDPTIDIPGGGSRFLDVLEVRGSEPDWAYLTVTSAPVEGIRLAATQDPYELQILLVGDSIHPRHYTLAVVHEGQWNGRKDSLAGHLATQLRSPPAEPAVPGHG